MDTRTDENLPGFTVAGDRSARNQSDKAVGFLGSGDRSSLDLRISGADRVPLAVEDEPSHPGVGFEPVCRLCSSMYSVKI